MQVVGANPSLEVKRPQCSSHSPESTGDALFVLLFIFAAVCAIGKVQENQEGLELNGTNHCAIDVYLQCKNISTIKNTEPALDSH
jgi:hypothetical protein